MNSSDPRWEGREAGHCLPGGTLWVSFRLPSCTCQPCMYVWTFPPPPPLHTSSFLYFILSLTSLLTLPTLTLTSLHSPSLTPHTPHTDTEDVFRLMVWVLDDRQKKQLHPLTLTPSHRAKLEWTWSVGYIMSHTIHTGEQFSYQVTEGNKLDFIPHESYVPYTMKSWVVYITMQHFHMSHCIIPGVHKNGQLD